MANHLSWYDTVLFPSTVYVKILLEFLIQHHSTTKLNKKVFFYVVSYSSFLVMISTSLVSCMWKLFFARKKIHNFSPSSLKIKSVSFLIKWFINDSFYSKLILLRFQVLNWENRYKRSFKSHSEFRSSPPDVSLWKNVPKICRKFTGEHPCWSAISINLGLTLLKLHFSKGVLF